MKVYSVGDKVIYHCEDGKCYKATIMQIDHDDGTYLLGMDEPFPGHSGFVAFHREDLNIADEYKKYSDECRCWWADNFELSRPTHS